MLIAMNMWNSVRHQSENNTKANGLITHNAISEEPSLWQFIMKNGGRLYHDSCHGDFVVTSLMACCTVCNCILVDHLEP